MRAALDRLKSAWNALRSRYWASLLFDVALILALFGAIHAWQTRGLPAHDERPSLPAVWLDEWGADRLMVQGEVGVIYFFAPWCFYCRHTIRNLDELVASGQLGWARVVALDYGHLDEVRAFIRETGVNLPVLLGGAEVARDWNIRAFPTYFVIAPDGSISGRSVGYATSAGLRARTWMAGD